MASIWAAKNNKNKENILRLIKAVTSPCNGVTLCTGSLGIECRIMIYCDII